MAALYHHPAPEDITLLPLLRAIADPVRLGIICHLHSLKEANCTTLLRGRPKSSMSHHFQVLREAGILQTRVEGVQHRNTLRLDVLENRFPGLMVSILRECPTNLPEDS
ncbi:helix-turn-helix transcriptional regulator [Acetobacteraceae bacterium B3987]|nr:helix-turn-helix transcriptional regulator [Acetobacteraceae bacterium B3987]